MTRLRTARLLLPALALSLLVGACSDSDSNDPPDAGGTPPGQSAELPTTTLNASGASFQKTFQDAAIEAFKDPQPNVTINYQSTGSGKGKTDLAGQVVDFAGTDSLISASERANYKGGEVLYFPLVAGPIAVPFNLSGVDKITLDPPTVAKIFLRQVKTWNDPAIAALNSGAQLPSTAITVAVRQDSSGTTENFTKFLKKAAPAEFNIDAGSAPTWPADVTRGAQNTGVAQIVKQTNGAIGYVDLADAKASGLKSAAVVNRAGKPVEPTLEGVSAALATAPLNPDLTFDPLFADGDASYPIASPTWIIAYARQPDPAKGQALKAYLKFIYDKGQDLAAENDYARLSENYVTTSLAQVDKLQIG